MCKSNNGNNLLDFQVSLVAIDWSHSFDPGYYNLDHTWIHFFWLNAHEDLNRYKNVSYVFFSAIMQILADSISKEKQISSFD